MILGIGTDIIEIERIKAAVSKHKNFLNKIFTESEIEYFKNRNMNMEVISGNFAAKEAVSKSIGTGIRNISFIDIEVLRDDLGKPIVSLNEKILENIKSTFGDGLAYKIHISISHSKNNAIAYAVLELIT